MSLASELPQTRFASVIDQLVRRLGDLLAVTWWLLLLVIVLNVVSRYLFAQGRIELEELQWHLYAVGFLLGLSVAYVDDAHIRVDVLRERWHLVTRAWIELYGILLLLLPFVALVIYASLPFISYSFATGEVSEAPGGLPLRWLIKSALLAGFILLLLTALARLTRVTCFLFGWPSGLVPATVVDEEASPS